MAEKSINLLPVSGKMNLDASNEVIGKGDYKKAINYQNNDNRTSGVGLGGNIKGNTLLTGYTKYAGDRVIGRAKYEKENSEIHFVYNSTAANQRILLVTETTVTLLLQANWLNFQDKLMNNPKCYDDYVVFTDGVNEPRMFNIQWMLNWATITNNSNGVIYQFEEIQPARQVIRVEYF